ncbi:hypothetical protein P8452_34791 [Trifolium repens]|nr:hypothetical protein P8452_34791 [Trifolium repens]
MFVKVAITIVQHGDNFANIGGSIFGIGFGFVIFTRPLVNRLCCTAVLIIAIVGLLIGMIIEELTVRALRWKFTLYDMQKQWEKCCFFSSKR